MTTVLSRSTDPQTSFLAADLMRDTGAASAHRDKCLAEVRRHPGSTAAEVAFAVGLERHEPSRRLPELRQAGLVVNGASRKCRVMGKASLTWFSVAAVPQEVSA